MKSLETIKSDLDRMVQSHYYSEDFELLSAFQAYKSQLADPEKDRLAEVAFQRLIEEGSMVNILLCSVVQVPSAVPVLAEKLNREPYSSQVTRALITALKTYRADEAYVAVERFLDSDQEMETLQALAQIDFVRTLPYMARLMKREACQGIILHMLHARMKEVGLDQLAGDLRQSSATKSATFQDHLAQTLRSKKGGYNPFSEEEIMLLLQSMA